MLFTVTDHPSLIEKTTQSPTPRTDAEQDKLQELATEHIALAEENQKLQDRLASKVLHATEEEQNQALSLIDDLRSKITQLEAENAALKVSRDEYQMKASEYLKQMTYWKRRAEKSERQAA